MFQLPPYCKEWDSWSSSIVPWVKVSRTALLAVAIAELAWHIRRTKETSGSGKML